jgi:multidrug efflux pump subunit AcrA (membrane-fusion protein)
MRLKEKWHLYLLALAAAALAVLAVLEIGPPSSSARTAREVITADDGVIQSTVSGTGNVEAGTDEDVNFRTSGTLETVFVSTGQHVKAGQLLAQLNPASAQLSLDQAEESLTSAEDQLTATENGTASGSGSGGGGSSGGGSSTGASYTGAQGSTEFVSETTTTNRTPPRRSAPATRPSTTTTSSKSKAPAPSSSSASSGSRSGASSSSKSATTPRTTTTTTTPTPSPSAIASAQAAVYGAQANVDNAEQALAETKLYAPVSGTIASMANLVPGDAVSAGSTSSVSGASSSSSSTSGTGSGGAGGGAATAGSLGGSSGSSSASGGSGSSSPFAEIVNTGTMSMTVAFSESDISKIKVGQPATITMDALAGVELAAHVSQISDVGTASSSVVSYDATLTVEETDPQVKPGMSASASVIVSQAQGVSVPNAAVSGSGSLASVNLLQGSKTVQHQVVVGLRGDSRTQIVSGLSAGQQLVVTETLPSLSTSATSTTSGTRGFGGGLGGGGLGGGGLFRGGGLGGGGGGLFRGGG